MLNLKNARKPAQIKQMIELKKQGICPFCQKHLSKTHANPVEMNGEYWVVTKNDYPYNGTKIHYLLIHKKHISKISQISPKASIELIRLIKKICRKHSVLGETLVMRSGDTSYTGASIEHLHAHVISGAKQNKKAEILTTTIGWKR